MAKGIEDTTQAPALHDSFKESEASDLADLQKIDQESAKRNQEYRQKLLITSPAPTMPTKDPNAFPAVGLNPDGTVTDKNGVVYQANGQAAMPQMTTPNGNTVTYYGATAKIVDKNGEVHWATKDAEGKLTPISEPTSTQMAEAANKGSSPNQHASILSWDDAIINQNQKNDQALREDAAKRLDFARKSLAEKKRIRAERDVSIGNAFGTAANMFAGGDGVEIKQINGRNYKVLYLGGDSFETNNNSDIQTANKNIESRGNSARISSIMVRQPVDDKGDPTGGDPEYYVVWDKYEKDGTHNPRSLERIPLGVAMQKYADAIVTANGLDADSAKQTAYAMFGGKFNPLGWQLRDANGQTKAERVKTDSIQATTEATRAGVKQADRALDLKEKTAEETKALNEKKLDADIKHADAALQLERDKFNALKEQNTKAMEAAARARRVTGEEMNNMMEQRKSLREAMVATNASEDELKKFDTETNAWLEQWRKDATGGFSLPKADTSTKTTQSSGKDNNERTNGVVKDTLPDALEKELMGYKQRLLAHAYLSPDERTRMGWLKNLKEQKGDTKFDFENNTMTTTDGSGKTIVIQQGQKVGDYYLDLIGFQQGRDLFSETPPSP